MAICRLPPIADKADKTNLDRQIQADKQARHDWANLTANIVWPIQLMPVVNIELVTTENECGVASQAMPALSPVLFVNLEFCC